MQIFTKNAIINICPVLYYKGGKKMIKAIIIAIYDLFVDIYEFIHEEVFLALSNRKDSNINRIKR